MERLVHAVANPQVPFRFLCFLERAMCFRCVFVCVCVFAGVFFHSRAVEAYRKYVHVFLVLAAAFTCSPTHSLVEINEFK